MKPTNDWHEVVNPNIKTFSANGVPYPLDDYLELTKQPTTDEIVNVIKRWRW